MRGAGDQLTIGERVAFYRRRRGLGQRTLGDLVGRSEDWVSKIERGVRELRRLDVIQELAHVLRVEMGDLRLDLGDIDYVVRVGPTVGAENLPPERRVSHMIDVGHALSLVAQDEESTQLLLEAESLAPYLVRHNPSVRETVKALYRRAAASRQGSTTLLGSFAERCRALA